MVAASHRCSDVGRMFAAWPLLSIYMARPCALHVLLVWCTSVRRRSVRLCTYLTHTDRSDQLYTAPPQFSPKVNLLTSQDVMREGREDAHAHGRGTREQTRSSVLQDLPSLGPRPRPPPVETCCEVIGKFYKATKGQIPLIGAQKLI